MHNSKFKVLDKTHRNQSADIASSLMDKWVLLIGIAIFLIILTPIGYLIVRGILTKSSGDIRIDLRNKDNDLNDKRFAVDECDDCKALVVKDKKNNTVFKESLEKTGNSEENEFREYLINKAEESGREKTTLKFFNNQFSGRRLVDISFDISNSVIDKEYKSITNKSDIKYSDLILQKLKEYMKTSRGIIPRDQINIRYYGPEFKDNPCNSNLVINYSEWEWEANIIYSQRNRQILIELGDKLNPIVEESDRGIDTNDEEEIYRIIGNFYSKGITNSNSGCHFGTYLIPHLIKISDDIVNRNYGNYEFVLVTDGEFYLEDDEVTAGKNVSVTPENFEVLEKYLQKPDKVFKANGSTICKQPYDKFIIMGMQYNNKLPYRNKVQEFYSELLKPCQVLFENY